MEYSVFVSKLLNLVVGSRVIWPSLYTVVEDAIGLRKSKQLCSASPGIVEGRYEVGGSD